MSVSADTLELLIAQGVGGDALVAIVRAIEIDNGPAQSSGAERQRRYRERLRNAQECDVTDNVTRDVTDSDAPPSLDKKAPQTPKKINLISGVGNAPARKAWSCPEGVDPDHWRDFLANRKTKRLTNNVSAYRKLLTDLGKFADDEWPPGKLVEFAAERGWGAIFDPRSSGNHNAQRPANDHRNGGYRDPILGDAFEKLRSGLGPPS